MSKSDSTTEAVQPPPPDAGPAHELVYFCAFDGHVTRADQALVECGGVQLRFCKEFGAMFPHAVITRAESTDPAALVEALVRVLTFQGVVVRRSDGGEGRVVEGGAPRPEPDPTLAKVTDAWPLLGVKERDVVAALVDTLVKSQRRWFGVQLNRYDGIDRHGTEAMLCWGPPVTAADLLGPLMAACQCAELPDEEFNRHAVAKDTLSLSFPCPPPVGAGSAEVVRIRLRGLYGQPSDQPAGTTVARCDGKP